MFEIGEVWKNRRTQSIYIILQVNNTKLTYLVKGEGFRNTVYIDDFESNMNIGNISRIGRMEERELTKFLLIER